MKVDIHFMYFEKAYTDYYLLQIMTHVSQNSQFLACDFEFYSCHPIQLHWSIESGIYGVVLWKREVTNALSPLASLYACHEKKLQWERSQRI